MTNLMKRLGSRIVRQLIDFGLYSRVRQLDLADNLESNTRNRILLIGPGEIEIPSNGWGAVETIIAETKTLYEKHGYQVTILNSNFIFDWIGAGKKYNVIISHNDRKTMKIRNRWRSIPLITYSHYGYGEFEEMWSRDYRSVVKSMNQSDYVICLNARVKNVYSNYIDASKLIVCPNGSSFGSFRVQEKNNRFVCIGKVENRKRQYEAWIQSESTDTKIDFIGPVADLRVRKLLVKNEDAQSRFIGPKSRQEVSEVLEGYKALILPSLGEADALVLYEAQLAGIPVFVTSKGVGAQDISLEWIKIIPIDFNFEELVSQLSSIAATQSDIQNYAKINYSWDVRHHPVLELLKKIANDRD